MGVVLTKSRLAGGRARFTAHDVMARTKSTYVCVASLFICHADVRIEHTDTLYGLRSTGQRIRSSTADST